MIIDTTPPKTEGSFHKCCSCGCVVNPSFPATLCSCENNVLAFYPECPKCKDNKIPISHCRFCTNSGYDDEYYVYTNGYLEGD